MARVVIDIPDEDFSLLCEAFGEVELKSTLNLRLQSAVAHGTVLPKGYGDLIDREEFLKSFLDSFWGAVKEGNSSFEVVGVVKNIIRNAPTVVEADKESRND